MKRKIFFLLPALLCAALLAGCSGSALDIFFPTPSPTATAEPTPSPTAEPTPTAAPTSEPLVPYEGEIRFLAALSQVERAAQDSPAQAEGPRLILTGQQGLRLEFLPQTP